MNRISLLLLILLILISSNICAATNKYYEIDFTYQNIINNKEYSEEVILLRDKGWLEENNIHKAGDTLILNIPELGVVNAKATAKEVKSTNLNPIKAYTNNQSMVTGTFKHYSTDVREYTLKNTKTGSIQNIQATPNHAFYVQNRTAFNKALNEQSHFIEIQNITPNDKLINEAGNVVQLVCDNKVCGKQLVTNNKPIAVYNLEIFNQHQYLVVSNNTIKQNSNISINNAVLVHNTYVSRDSLGADDENASSLSNFGSSDNEWYLEWAAPLVEYDISSIKADSLGIKDKESFYNSKKNNCSLRALCLLAGSYNIDSSNIQEDWFYKFNSGADFTEYRTNLEYRNYLKSIGLGMTLITDTDNFNIILEELNDLNHASIFMYGDGTGHVIGMYRQENHLLASSDDINNASRRYSGYRERFNQFILYKIESIPTP
ncbi:hypothetical protein ACFX5K_01740 [Rickettsiales bacterium LUAb2]